tara:strand:+ start:6598 stop:7842 length:1245 start_codon:yes stop_codon:yes gene_type:complete
MEFNLFTFIFLFAILSSVLTLLWLNFRQDRAINNSFDSVPEGFTESIQLEDHQKAGNYTKAKIRLNHFEIIFSTIVLLAWTLGGAMNSLDAYWSERISDPALVGTFFVLSILLIASFIDIPFSIYRTFILEQKFGFNRMNAKTFIGDLFKEIILTLVLMLPLVYAILYLMNFQAIGNYWWIYVWLIITGFSLVMMWIYPSYIAPIFNKFNPLENENLKDRITDLLERTGFGSDGIFVMDGSKRSSHGNAYFTGIGKNKRIVFFDTLLKGMEDKEIEAILAHELGHFHHKHTQKRMASTFVFSFLGLALLGFLINQTWFYNGLGIDTPSSHTALVLFSLVLPVFSFFINPISNLVSRNHEFQADAFAANHTDANDLISSLIKLYKENSSSLSPDSFYSAFHDSHPSAVLRIERLR